MRPWRVAICAFTASIALAWPNGALAETLGDVSHTPRNVRFLDVPFVPQTVALCGGATLAMVLRYWGKSGVFAEEFTAWVEPNAAGIRTGSMVQAVVDLGWSAFPFAGTPAEVQSHLAGGRPVIALIRTASDSFHYVVLVAWANGWVVLHDPSLGPFRVVRESEFDTAWAGGGRWALLVLPPSETDDECARDLAVTATTMPAVQEDECEALVDAGIVLAQAGDTTGAEREFLVAQSRCPRSAAPLRERAGLRFRAEDWAGANRLCESALALDPDDTHVRRLLAGSRFLAGDVDGALRAWNHLSEPRIDLTRIDGLSHIRYSAVAGQLSLRPGELLTPQHFRQARRRLAELPAKSESRLSLRPLPGGTAQVIATLLERPPVLDNPWALGRKGIQALVGGEVTLEVASPTGNGELWAGGWRWQSNRPRVALAVTLPAPRGRPGIWRVDGLWERQTYGVRVVPDASDPTRGEPIQEERRRTALSFSDWIRPDFRLELGTGLDNWTGRGAHLSLEGSVERRLAGDRLAVSTRLAKWSSLEGGASFAAMGLSSKWCSDNLAECDAWQGRLGISSTTREAPLDLWSGAGTGSGRDPLLRAHPLLRGGIIQGRVFARTLANGTIERQAWRWRLGPLQLGWALFVDAAKPWPTSGADNAPWQVDGGAGLRLRGLGMHGSLRLDVARGLQDGSTAVSIGWQLP